MSDCPYCEIEDRRKRQNLACYRAEQARNATLRAENDQLRAEVKALRGQNEALKARIERDETAFEEEHGYELAPADATSWDARYDAAMQARDWQTCEQLLEERRTPR